MFYRPTILEPTIAKAIDATVDNEFTWQPNGDESMVAFQIFIKKNSDNTLVFDSNKVTSSTPSYTLAANTLTNNIEYKWMVRVWKNDTEYIDSNWVVFKTNSIPSVVLNLQEISAPNFIRNSPAYLPNGQLVNTNQPRFIDTNLIPVSKRDFSTGWTAYQDATVTVTQNQVVPEWNTDKAVRIQTSGGTNVLKYYISIVTPSANGQYYHMFVKIKNIGTKTVRVFSNAGQKYENVLPGETKDVFIQDILGDGSTHLQMQFRALDPNDSLDFIVYMPGAWKKEEYIPPEFGQAVLVEEGTTNLTSDPLVVSANIPSTTSRGTWGNWTFGSWDGFLHEKVTAEKFPGYAIKVTYSEPNSGGQDFWNTNWKDGITPGNTYTLSFYAKGNGTIQIRCHWAGILSTIVLTPQITRYSVTFTHNGTTSQYPFIACATLTSGQWAHFEGFQLEQKPYPTSFTDGTRSPETMTIPTAGVLNPQEGTIEFWWCPINQPASTMTGSQLVAPPIIQVGNYHQNNSWILWCGIGSQLRLLVRGDNATGWTGQWTIIPNLSWYQLNRWYHIVVRWENANTFWVFIDGVKYGPYVSSQPFTGIAGNIMSLGRLNAVSGPSNALYDDLRISSRARSDEEVAAAYASGQPLPVDEYTTYKLDFDGNLSNKPKIIINSQNYTFAATYNQTESVPLHSYKFLLYDDKDNLLQSTDWLYDGNLSYEFGGLESGKFYKIECIALAQNGVEVSSGKVPFIVQYDYPYNNLTLTTTPIKESGAIQVSWHLKQVIGKVTGDYSYVNGKFGYSLYLPPGSILHFSDNIPETFTIPFFIKLPSGFSGVFLKLGDDFEVGYDGARFYYKRGYRLTAGRSVVLPTDFFTVSVKGDTVIIHSDSYSEVIK